MSSEESLPERIARLRSSPTIWRNGFTACKSRGGKISPPICGCSASAAMPNSSLFPDSTPRSGSNKTANASSARTQSYRPRLKTRSNFSSNLCRKAL